MKGRSIRVMLATILGLGVAGCAVSSGGASPSAPPASTSTTQQAPQTVQISADQAARLKSAMLPLLQVLNRPLSPGQVKIGVMNDPHINAANAGNAEFFVTTGLLQKANDEQLRAVLAHELAHQDLGHVAKAQALGTGLNIGMVILDQIFPGSGQLTPVAGTLIANAYSRKEEYEADAHGAEILQRAGYPRKVMEDTLTWLLQTEGPSGGGFFATHPATDDRITALRRTTQQQ